MNVLQRYGPWAVVTGASSGIGLAFATLLASKGFNVALVARRGAMLAEIAGRLHERFSVETREFALDLAHADANEALFRATDDLDIGLLVAAAGFGTSGSFLASDICAELQMLEVNCAAVVRQSRYFGERLAKRGRGGIILMGSLLGFQGVARSANYAATKAYVQSLAEGLHAELKPRGIDVISSAPGPVKSGFEDRANMRMRFAQTPESVATATFNALGRSSTAVPGALSKLLSYSLAPLPRSIRSAILGQIMADMTMHQQ